MIDNTIIGRPDQGFLIFWFGRRLSDNSVADQSWKKKKKKTTHGLLFSGVLHANQTDIPVKGHVEWATLGVDGGYRNLVSRVVSGRLESVPPLLLATLFELPRPHSLVVESSLLHASCLD